MFVQQAADSRFFSITGHQRACFGLLLEIVSPTAKEHIHAGADVGGEVGLARFILGRGLGIQTSLCHCGRPCFFQITLPVLLKRGGGLGFDEHGDLGSATGHTPVDV